MELLTNDLVNELLTVGQAPCFSLYMPTHRRHPDYLQDPIRFKNLVKQLKESALKKYTEEDVDAIMQPFENLVSKDKLWNNNMDGLAVFAAEGVFKVVGLNEQVEELAIVADSFHTKPLRHQLQSIEWYYLLGITLHDMRLFIGNRHHLQEFEMEEDAPKTIEIALGDELTDKHSTVASYGGTGDDSSMHHGHGSKKDEVDKDAERYFRVVSKYVYENHSKITRRPLILAALPEHQGLFRKIDNNQYLVERGINLDPNGVSVEKLMELAWEVMEPEYEQRLDAIASRYGQEAANGKAGTDPKEVAAAAVEGRVDTLLVEADRIIPMRITNLITGNIQNKDMDNPKVDDLLDDMGELVMKMGGNVVVLPAGRMPSDTGLAAIYRY